ncbi:MAG: rhomboid family intramembrane serine protease [Anaerolineae bacterium]
MIPIGDDNQRRRIAFVNWLIIIVNVIVWLYEVTLSGPTLDRFISTSAIVPARITSNPNFTSLFTIISAMFMHGGWLHIAGNMLYLAIFGDNIEERFGHIAYLFFYLIGGVIAAAAQIITSPNSTVPVLGASGAIAAVLGAYLAIYPTNRVRVLVIFFFFIRVVALPAILVLGFWFILQIFNGVATIAATASGGTAWFAHIGGFLFGLVIGLIVRAVRPAQGPPYFIPRVQN